MIDTSQLYFAELAVDLGAGVKDVLRQAILEDLEHARRLGAGTEFETAYLDAVELALRGEYGRCEQVCRDCLKSCTRMKQADVFMLLAWNAYLRHLETIPKADLEKVDLADAPDLREARDHLSAAIDLRRSDADLYLFRAHIHLWIADQVFGYLASDRDEKPLVARVRTERERIEKVQREACAAARADLEIAAKIRPGNAETRLLVSDLHLGSFPIGMFFDLFFAEPNRDLGRKMVREALEPARGVCKEVLGKDPANLRAWVQLSLVNYMDAIIGMLTSEPFSWDEFLDSTARALALHPEPHVEAYLRFQKALAHGMRYLTGGKQKPEDRRVALEELERAAALRPSMRKQFEQWFPDLK